MRTILAPLFAAVLCLSLLAGCSSKKSIVGKWQNDGGAQFEFTSDGKLLMSLAGIGGDPLKGTYTLPDDGHVTMAMDQTSPKDAKTLAYKIDGDTLTIDADGKKDAMKRIK